MSDWSVVALVASSGGLQAVQTVLERLDADVPAAFIVLIHQSPEAPGLLHEILGRASALRVRQAVARQALEPGVVDVVVPGEHLIVDRDGSLRTIVAGAAPPNRPSADLLLTTLATAMHDRVIAVVLSGYGHDGATGATAVHEFGGTVLASDAATSEVFSMPKATIERDSAIDHVAPVDGIPDLVRQIAAGRGGPGASASS